MLEGINQDIYSRHYSIYAQTSGSVGETFYDVDRNRDLARLDIKLLPRAQAKASPPMRSATLSTSFSSNLATKAYADPHPKNKKASRLCEQLGFVSKPRPTFLPKGLTYLEVTQETFKSAYPGSTTT